MNAPDRSEVEMIEGVVPAVPFITLGQTNYPATEPPFPRAQAILVLQGQYQDLANNKKLTDAERLGRVNEIMIAIVRGFSAAIENDWTTIEQEATTEQLLVAVGLISQVVNAPFMRRALAVAPATNRKTRRTK